MAFFDKPSVVEAFGIPFDFRLDGLKKIIAENFWAEEIGEECGRIIGKVHEATSCILAAYYILYLFIREIPREIKSDVDILDIYDVDVNTFKFLQILQTDDKAYSHNPIKKSFEPSKFNDNFLFHLKLYRVYKHYNCYEHSIIINKQSNGYFVFQGFVDKFTLGEWLGIVGWANKDELDTKRFELYGKGKKLSFNEIKEFLQEVIPSERGYRLQINRYKISSKMDPFLHFSDVNIICKERTKTPNEKNIVKPKI
jgi:hypothetical protein